MVFKVLKYNKWQIETTVINNDDTAECSNNHPNRAAIERDKALEDDGNGEAGEAAGEERQGLLAECREGAVHSPNVVRHVENG